MNGIVFLIVRASHVLVAAIWVGSTILMSYFMIPAIEDVGPGGGPVLGAMGRRSVGPFFGAIAGITMLSGIWLLWRFTGGFDPAVSRSPSGMAFGIGGVAGILAGILAGAVVGRASNALMELGAKLQTLPEGPERAAIAQQMAPLRVRTKSWSRIVIVLQVIALLLMSIGHYI